MTNITTENIDLMKPIKDRIKKDFAQMIPDEKWEGLIKQIVDDWFKKPTNNLYNNSSYKYSEFELLVIGELNTMAKNSIKEYLSINYPIVWEGTGQIITGEKIEEFFIKNSGAMFKQMMQEIMAQTINNLQYR